MKLLDLPNNILFNKKAPVSNTSERTRVILNPKLENYDHLDKKSRELVKKTIAFFEERGKAKLKVVETGIQDDTNIEITSGLSKGDKIITGPYNMVSKTLKPGDLLEEKSKKEKSSEEKEE